MLDFITCFFRSCSQIFLVSHIWFCHLTLVSIIGIYIYIMCRLLRIPLWMCEERCVSTPATLSSANNKTNNRPADLQCLWLYYQSTGQDALVNLMPSARREKQALRFTITTLLYPNQAFVLQKPTLGGGGGVGGHIVPSLAKTMFSQTFSLAFHSTTEFFVFLQSFYRVSGSKRRVQ